MHCANLRNFPLLELQNIYDGYILLFLLKTLRDMGILLLLTVHRHKLAGLKQSMILSRDKDQRGQIGRVTCSLHLLAAVQSQDRGRSNRRQR
jgi:hypothetical protein